MSNNNILKAYYSDLKILFDLFQPYMAYNIELLKEEDETEYENLLKTTVVSANTSRNFPQITKEKQELVGDIKKESIGFNTVSIILTELCFSIVNSSNKIM